MVVMLVMLVSCGREYVSDSRIALGTAVYLSIDGDQETLSDAFDVIYDADRAISAYTDGSWVWKINSSAGKSPVEVPSEIFTLIERSFDMAYETDGVFNPMIGPLVRLWGIGTENARIPAQSEIESVLPLLDYHQAVLDEDRHTVFLPEEGMALDLGAVGKGWTSDLVRDFLAERGVESAIINLGGNITVMGDHDGKPWRVGIQRPWAGGGSYFTIVEAEDTSLVTSGGYQRYIEDSDGTIYSHILSSSTGYPVETDLLSATAITSDGTLADMLSTVMFASGSVKAQEIAAGFGIRAVLLTEDSAVIDTDSPEGEVTVLEE